MTGHDTHKPASSTRVGIALVLTVLATGAVAAQELPRSGQAALLPPRPDLILAEVEIPDGSSLNFRIRGTPVTLTNQAVACKSDPAPVTGHVKTVEILVDRTSIETFVNEGEVSLGSASSPPATGSSLPATGGRHASAPSAYSRSSRYGAGKVMTRETIQRELYHLSRPVAFGKEENCLRGSRPRASRPRRSRVGCQGNLGSMVVALSGYKNDLADRAEKEEDRG